MVPGILIQVAQKWIRFGKLLMVEITSAYRTTAEQLGVHEGSLTPIAVDFKEAPGVLECGRGSMTSLPRHKHWCTKESVENVGEDGVITRISSVRRWLSEHGSM